MVEKLVPDLFLKIEIEHISYHSLLLLYVQVDRYGNILKLRCSPLTFTSYKAFPKNKKRSGTSLPASFFCMIFEEKYFSRYILLTDQISLSNSLYFLKYWAIFVL